MLTKIKNSKEKIALIIGNVSIAIAVMIMCNPVLCDTLGKASENAAKGIQTTAQGMVKWILAIVLVVAGFICIAGSQRQREGMKEKAPLAAIGVALILGAIGVATLIVGWF